MNTYNFHSNLYDIAFLATTFTGLIFALQLWFVKKKNRAANRLLALALGAMTLWIAWELGTDIGLGTYILLTGWLPLCSSLAIGPFLFFYVLRITRSEYKLRAVDLLHFGPLLLPFLFKSSRTGVTAGNMLPAFMSVSIYLWLCHRLIESFYRRQKFNGGDRHHYELRWLHILVKRFGLLWLLWIPFTAVNYFYRQHQLDVMAWYPFYLLASVMVTWIGAAAFLKPENDAVAEMPSLPKPQQPADLRQKGAWLKRMMAENRYYQDPELSLNSLAEKLGVHTHELSRIINTALKKSFNDFVNEYRVRDVAQKMQDPAYDHITLLGIAFESGFNSQTTFNRTFKQIAGKSPQEYKNSPKKEQSSYKLGSYSQFAPVISIQQITPTWYEEKLNRIYMFRNYFKIAFRGFWRHKLFTLINTIGLSIGISAFLVIYLIVHYDFTFDKFHKDSDRIYRVVMNITFQGQITHSSGVPGPLSGAIKSQATGIEGITPLYTLSPHFVYIDKDKDVQKRFKDPDRLVLTDQQYFKIFNYKWLAGSSEHALDAPNQVVLTSQQARLYFPSLSYHDMIGKAVTYDTLKVAVSGIVETLTKNTDFTFHDFISISTATVDKRFFTSLRMNVWRNIFSGSQVFLKLAPGVSAPNAVKQINTIFRKNYPLTPDEKAPANKIGLALQKLNDIHLNPDYNIFDFSTQASKTTLYGLSVIGGFLLLLACINFVNLTTAQASQRAKEIGIRKTLGSSRMQLVVQFLSETLFITLFAVIISVLLAPVILKMFADFISPNIHANFIHQPDVILFLLALTIVVSILSGFYPAIMMAGYRPVSVLKNQVQGNSGKTRNVWLRKSLTVSQFIVAQFFIMATIFVSKQIYYALHKDLGFKKEAILIVRSPWQSANLNGNKVLLNYFRSMPQVALASLGDQPPSSFIFDRMQGIYYDGKNQILTPEVIFEHGDENFIKIYQIKLIAGRNIQESDTGRALIINNTYAKMLGFDNPRDAIGKQLSGFDNANKASIIGVVADYNQRSLHSPIYPSVILPAHNRKVDKYTLHISLKPETVGGNEWKTAIASMGKAFKKIYPDDDFDYSFFDDTIAKFYEEEQHTSILLGWATGFSILISCLGLLGLAIYTTNHRTKEIGIRKVFGASVTRIVTLLSTELIWLILLAFIIVTPIAWYAVSIWMENFDDHVAISWWVFVAGGAGMLLTALFTLSFQTIKAAMANPVRSLRNE